MKKITRKFWAREILIFWSSLLVTGVIYLLSHVGVVLFDYVKNNDLRKAIVIEQQIIDSLIKEDVSRFSEVPVINIKKEKKREELFHILNDRKLFTDTYSDFVVAYCCDLENQEFLYEFLSKDGDFEVGSFKEFQEVLFGDYLNPDYELNKEKVWDHKLRKGALGNRIKTLKVVNFKYFVLVWFIITYPLRIVIFSILWAVKVVKE